MAASGTPVFDLVNCRALTDRPLSQCINVHAPVGGAYNQHTILLTDPVPLGALLQDEVFVDALKTRDGKSVWNNRLASIQDQPLPTVGLPDKHLMDIAEGPPSVWSMQSLCAPRSLLSTSSSSATDQEVNVPRGPLMDLNAALPHVYQALPLTHTEWLLPRARLLNPTHPITLVCWSVGPHGGADMKSVSLCARYSEQFVFFDHKLAIAKHLAVEGPEPLLRRTRQRWIPVKWHEPFLVVPGSCIVLKKPGVEHREIELNVEQ
jgi:hypothetical protein